MTSWQTAPHSAKSSAKSSAVHSSRPQIRRARRSSGSRLNQFGGNPIWRRYLEPREKTKSCHNVARALPAPPRALAHGPRWRHPRLPRRGRQNPWTSRGLGVALITRLSIRMSCRIAVNMAKRAAAGAMSVPVWPNEETESPFPAANLAPISRSNGKLASRRTTTLRYDLGRVIAVAFAVFAALSFVSYAAYAHQWSELSALRHLGKASPAPEYLQLQGDRKSNRKLCERVKLSCAPARDGRSLVRAA